MSDEDEISEAGRKQRFERWERLGVDVIRTDLEATGGRRFVGGPPNVRKLAWEWLRMKEAGSEDRPAPTKAKTELFSLKPSFWGMSRIAKQAILDDLKSRGRRVWNYSAKEIAILADAYFDHHRDELLAKAAEQFFRR